MVSKTDSVRKMIFSMGDVHDQLLGGFLADRARLIFQVAIAHSYLDESALKFGFLTVSNLWMSKQ